MPSSTWARSKVVLLFSAAMIVVAMAVPAHASSLTQTWAQRYVGGTDFQYGQSLAVSPDGATAYVTGISAGPAQQGDPYDVFATIAYNTSNGDVRWLDRYAFAQIDNWASKIVVSPDGQKVFVTGATPDGYPVIAYDATNGDRLWVKSVPFAGFSGTEGTLTVSPDSKLVFFAGEVQIGDGPGSRLVTRALDTQTGAKVWNARIDFAEGLYVRPNAIAVDTGGARVFVTGSLGNLNPPPNDTPPDFVTVAYDVSTGGQLWMRTYNGGANGADDAQAVAVTPNGLHVIVAGSSDGANGLPRYAVISYAAASGAKEWTTRDGSPKVGRSLADMTLSQDGTQILVTGTEHTAGVWNPRYRTAAYSVTDGAKLWGKSFTGVNGANAEATAIAVSPTYVYVTGSANDGTRDTYATVVYMASTGARIATAWYDGPEGVYALPEAIGALPGGVIVTGRGGGAFATVAYALYI